jgi:hypothetical protein
MKIALAVIVMIATASAMTIAEMKSLLPPPPSKDTAGF